MAPVDSLCSRPPGTQQRPPGVFRGNTNNCSGYSGCGGPVPGNTTSDFLEIAPSLAAAPESSGLGITIVRVNPPGQWSQPRELLSPAAFSLAALLLLHETPNNCSGYGRCLPGRAAALEFALAKPLPAA